MTRVVCFITRPRRGGADLLVFDHRLAGVQGPAGTMEPGEAPVDAARREAWEETGLDRLSSCSNWPPAPSPAGGGSPWR